MRRRNIGTPRMRRSIAFLTAAVFLLPFVFQYISFNNGSHYKYLLPRGKFKEVYARMEARREHLKKECSRLGLDDSSHKAYAWEYLINRQYHVIWCNIFKAASTSWMYNFNLMANYSAAFLDTVTECPTALVRKKYERPTVEQIEKAESDSISFIIVRHPMERLASTYNNKFVDVLPNNLYGQMGAKIVKKYRKLFNPKQEPTVKYPVFEEFVAFILDEAEAKRPLDIHWASYNVFCTPCKFKFDVILKFETLDEDQRYLIQLASLQDVVKPEWKNSGKAPAARQTINHLFSRLTRSQLDALYNLYRPDFQLFNYTIEGYYEIVQND